MLFFLPFNNQNSVVLEGRWAVSLGCLEVAFCCLWFMFCISAHLSVHSCVQLTCFLLSGSVVAPVLSALNLELEGEYHVTILWFACQLLVVQETLWTGTGVTNCRARLLYILALKRW